LPAKPYQTAIASAVQPMAERKNGFGLGKMKRTLSIRSQVRGFLVPLSEAARLAPDAWGKAGWPAREAETRGWKLDTTPLHRPN